MYILFAKKNEGQNFERIRHPGNSFMQPKPSWALAPRHSIFIPTTPVFSYWHFGASGCAAKAAQCQAQAGRHQGSTPLPPPLPPSPPPRPVPLHPCPRCRRALRLAVSSTPSHVGRRRLSRFSAGTYGTSPSKSVCVRSTVVVGGESISWRYSFFFPTTPCFSFWHFGASSCAANAALRQAQAGRRQGSTPLPPPPPPSPRPALCPSPPPSPSRSTLGRASSAPSHAGRRRLSRFWAGCYVMSSSKSVCVWSRVVAGEIIGVRVSCGYEGGGDEEWWWWHSKSHREWDFRCLHVGYCCLKSCPDTHILLCCNWLHNCAVWCRSIIDIIFVVI